VNWVTPFVQKTGCKVHVRTVRSSTELLDAVSNGRYDGVAAFGDVTQVLTGGHEVEPLDVSRIPHYRDIFPALKRLPQNLDGEKVVGVPHGRGPNLLLWRTDLVRPAPRSGDVLYDHRYAGRIGLYDAAVGLAPTAIPRSAQPVRARSRTVPQSRPCGRRPDAGYWQDLTNALADYTAETRSSARRARLAALLKGDKVPVATALPGLDRAVGSWMLLAGARHPGCPAGSTIVGEGHAASARYLHEAPATQRRAYMIAAPSTPRTSHAGGVVVLAYARTTRDRRGGRARTGSTGRTRGPESEDNRPPLRQMSP
jgi:putative spermidine/putrescine transport system substrate-binding protein